ncbi:hypothetical protein [Vibrio harveyi]
MSEIDVMRKTIKELHERVIMLEQLIKVSTRSAEPSGTTTVGALTNISAAQLEDNPYFYMEHPDGGFNAYLSQIVAEAQKNVPSKNLQGVIDKKIIPAAPESSTAGVGFGGFRYVLEGTTLKLFVS